jgi:hypothetical protein
LYIKDGTIILEQCPYPGNIGDSCPETSRYKLLVPDAAVDLHQFITANGIVRHPTAPEGWRESDTSGDQVEPLALTCTDLLREVIWIETKANGYRLGNGDLISPRLYAILTGRRWLLAICIFIQGLLFRFPYRWSDSKKQFESNETSSADYLNYIVAALHAPRWSRCLTSRALLKQKVRDYYKPEPNSDWVIQAYDAVISREFRK